MSSKSVYRIVTFLGLSLLTVLIANAQPGDPGVDPDVPITGIEILLAAGGALGIKRLIANKKSKNT
jgi:hypothetical protein